MSLFKEHDCVWLQKNFSTTLKIGLKGVVVLVYNTSNQTTVYEVEFMNENGEFVALETVPEEFLQLEELKN